MRGRVVIAAAAATLVAAGVGGAATFTDPVGDTPGPDINSVDITANAQNVVITVGLANRSGGLEDGEAVEVDVDTDNNASTGDESGIDLYGVVVGGDQPEVDVWKNGDFDISDAATIAWTDAGARLTIPLTLVSSKIAVSVQALGAEQPPASDNPPQDPGTDLAPDNGAYTVDVPQAPKATLRRSVVAFTPAFPRSGRAFRVRTVSVTLSSGGPFVAKATSCSATLGGKAFGKRGACAWKLPKNTSGKRLRISVNASYGATTYRLTRVFVVR